MEGGLVATDDGVLARRIAVGRNYGNPGDYDCEFPGLSARMAEVNGLVGLRSLAMVEENIAVRNALAKTYRLSLKELPGIAFQDIAFGDRTTYKDFAILVDETKFGLSRDNLAFALEAECIPTRKYFFPPLHKMRAYRGLGQDQPGILPVTERVSNSILCLPIYSHMPETDVERIASSITRIQRHCEAIVALQASGANIAGD
jgi:dTDP-4-amino-4,6-dideoxygalactose transaminase